MQKMLISPSPHIHGERTTRSIMLDVIIALIPSVIVSLVFYGWDELMVLCVSVAVCVLSEWAITKYLMHRDSTIADLSAVVTGILLALNLPSLSPWWMVAIGAVVAIGVAKMSFGGLGQNVFNPAIVARVFLLISFPVYMTTWAALDLHNSWVWGADDITGPTVLGMFKEGIPITTDVLLKNGSAGEISSIALLAGFVYLLIRKVIKPWITLSIIGTVFIFSSLVWFFTPDMSLQPHVEVLTGGLLLGSIFMATDYVTSPMTTKGGVIFGVGIGVLTMVIRYWGTYPEGVSFSILIMNAFVPLINRFCKSKKFGRA